MADPCHFERSLPQDCLLRRVWALLDRAAIDGCRRAGAATRGAGWQVLGNVRKGPLRESGAASSATIVTAGGHDHPIAAATIRRLHPDALVDSMGTANLVYGETTEVTEPRLDPYLAFSVPSMGNAGLSCLGVFELAAAIQPLRRPTDLVQRLLASERITGIPRDRPMPIPGSNELFVRSGDEPTEVDVRAVLEAATFYARRMFDEILAAGAAPAPIFATGGWARSHAFMELRASVFGQPLIVVDEPELTAIGAALIAAQGATGVAAPFGQGLNLRKIEPVEAWTERYAGLYQDYRAQLDATEGGAESSDLYDPYIRVHPGAQRNRTISRS
jgi:xylulokinase